MGSKKRAFKLSSLITPVIVLALSGYVLFHSIVGLNRTFIEDHWLRTEGVILSPDAVLPGKKNQERKTQGLEQTINYEYIVNGKVYQSNAAAKEAYVLADEFPEGKIVAVYYNPLDVTDAVLVRSPIQKHFLYVVILFCILLIGVVFYSLTKR